MDNYSDINLKGDSKIKVGDSLTISDSGVLGSNNKPMYLGVSYQGDVAIASESIVCFEGDFAVLGDAVFSGDTEFGNFPKISNYITPTSEDQFVTKKYVDDKVSEGSSGSSGTSIKIVNPSDSNRFTELKYTAGCFSLTNQCGTSYQFPEGSGSTMEVVTNDFISKGICTNYVCTNEVKISPLCGGGGLGRIFSTSELGLVVEVCSDLTLSGKSGDVNIEASCGSIKMYYSRGSSIITPNHPYGSSSTNPNVFVTSPYGDSGCGLHLMVLTQSEYDQMSSHDMTTIYFISGC